MSTQTNMTKGNPTNLLNGAGDSAYSMVDGIVEIVCRLVFVFVFG
jgi:hypothetical protein